VILPTPSLLLITDRRQATRPLPDIAAAAFAGGCRWLSLREKDLDRLARVALLRDLVAVGKGFGAAVMVHEDVEAALAAGAAGVHLPGGASPAAARARLGPRALIGLSTHAGAEIDRAAAEGADYATVSPIFMSASKPGYGPAVGLDGLARAVARARLPLLALGGIGVAEIAGCCRAGAAGVAVMGAVMASADPQATVSALISHLPAGLAAAGLGDHSRAE
jgi:thiamine-phosphate pyrophosphorylase